MLVKTKASRTYKPVELYSRKYYAERVQPDVQRILTASGSINSADRLAVIKDCTLAAYNNETPQIRAAILAELQAMKEITSAEEVTGDVERTPAQYQRCVNIFLCIRLITELVDSAINEANPLIRELLQELSRWTGWKYSLVGAGPSPIDGGQVRSMS